MGSRTRTTISVLSVGLAAVAVASMFLLDYRAPCRRSGPVADLDLAYHMPQPYAATSVVLNFLAPTALAIAVAFRWRGKLGLALAIVLGLVGGFAIWYVTDPVVWHNLCGPT